MKAYGFKYKVDYVVEAESEEEAVIAIADLIKRDWMGYIGSLFNFWYIGTPLDTH